MVTTIISIIYAVVMLILCGANEYLRKEKRMLEKEVAHQRINIDLLEMEKAILKAQNKCTTDQEIIDAVKYAMKMSHPDNNGNAEDFMKFRKLYKKITE